ncbi:MAG: FecR domain-containing protein [Thiobacillaceae bacterium]
MLVALGLLPAPASLAADRCEPWAAQLSSVQGRVEAKRMGTDRWQPVSSGAVFCPGDSLRVEALSRAAVLLPSETMLRLDQRTTITFPAVEAKKASWLDLLDGAVHFISRRPRNLQIKTPFVNAAIEGTEFVLRVGADQTELWVFEGRVLASNTAGSLAVGGGEAAVAKAGQPPMRLVVRLRDAVQWALYYPPLIDLRATAYEVGPAAKTLSEALERYQRGDPAGALARLDEVPPGSRDASYLALRDGLLLSVGRVDEADSDIAQALTRNPDDGIALALKSVIALAQSDKEQALALARQAVERAPNSPVPRIALSYAQEADFRIDAALESVQDALKLDPNNALARARLAEVKLSKGDSGGALEAAQKAVELNPNLARTETVLGFAHLTRIEIDQAKAAFEKAIALDQADPLPRLGLGLAKIRAGSLEAGRQEIEIATSLDPSNSLIRSYMGKAYFEEKRDALAGVQLAMAKELDPKDPTPWFYDAIRKQLDNRPVEAVADLQQSIQLNDNRAVYRSRLLLDEDAAVRGVSLARAYDDLGFDQLALLDAAKSLSIDPAEASAHRFLSDAYANVPRYEVARVSELLQAQLLQPLNINPVQPQLTETDLNIPAAAGPARAAFDEFTPMFARDQLRLTASGLVGNHQTWGDEVVASGIANRVSYSLGQFHYDTNGFRQGSDLKHDIYDAFVQASLTEQLDLQVEFRHRETGQGDLRLSYDPTFVPSERRTLDQNTTRLGMHWAASPRSDVIASIICSDRAANLNDPGLGDLIVDANQRGYDAQGQYLTRAERFNLALGAGSARIDSNQSSSFLGIPDPPVSGKINQNNAYAYINLKFGDHALWTLGLAFDTYDDGTLDLHQLSPKFGLRWNIVDGLQLRTVALRSLKRLLIVDQTLEPTQIAGFNQFFDDFNGTKAKLYGLGLDATFSSRLHGGLEGSRRGLEVPYGAAFSDQNETNFRAYLYWALHSSWALSSQYRFERIDGQALDPNFNRLDTTSIPIRLRYFALNGAYAAVGPTLVRQEVGATFADPTPEKFVVVDATLGYRLPRRRGIVSLDIRNLLNRKFHYQDLSFTSSDPFRTNPDFIPDRTILARFMLNF